jgi:hypothetical protein
VTEILFAVNWIIVAARGETEFPGHSQFCCLADSNEFCLFVFYNEWLGGSLVNFWLAKLNPQKSHFVVLCFARLGSHNVADCAVYLFS